MQCNHFHMVQRSCTDILQCVESIPVRIPAVLKAEGGTACYCRGTANKLATRCNVVISSWPFCLLLFSDQVPLCTHAFIYCQDNATMVTVSPLHCFMSPVSTAKATWKPTQPPLEPGLLKLSFLLNCCCSCHSFQKSSSGLHC